MNELSQAIEEGRIDLSSPMQLQRFSKELKRFIVKQGLFTPIMGKNYVNVEGWQFAGIATGVLPIIRKVENLSTDKELKYRCEIELQRNGQQVGYGVAVCSSKESKRKGADEYIIASMAQTRAIGKAYRNLFSFLMKMASFEPTPAEEMKEEMQQNKEAMAKDIAEIVNNTNIDEKFEPKPIKD